MAAHDTRVVNASGTYNNSGSNHNEARFWFRYSNRDISGCCPAAKNITRLTAAITAAMRYCAVAKRRVTAGLCPDVQALLGADGLPLAAAHMLYLATAAGAAALEMDGEVGDLSVGRSRRSAWARGARRGRLRRMG
jgi:hypothetical protein